MQVHNRRKGFMTNVLRKLLTKLLEKLKSDENIKKEGGDLGEICC